MAKRGFLAEMNHQSQLAQKRKRQQQAAANKAREAAAREAERAQAAAVRAQAAASRASEAEQRAAAKEVERLHAESRLAEVASMNADLATHYEEIDHLLEWALEFDAYVDLETLKTSSLEHPPFDPGDLGAPAAPLPDLTYPPQPEFVEPPAPAGLSAAFGGKKKHEEAVARARAEHEAAVQRWHTAATEQYNCYVAEQGRRQQVESERVGKLAEAQAAYDAECRLRESDAAEHNAQITKLINELAFDVEAAIQEYVGIVLGNSVYPDMFPVTHDHHFDLATRELTLTAIVPEPCTFPAVKEYKYAKAKDEITNTSLPVKEQKERYANAVWQLAVRTLHEIFNADRAAKIHSVSLTVGVERIAPATGLPETVPLVVVAADRVTFTKFDLHNVVPHATLAHLGAALSKSPNDLVPVDTTRGVRIRGTTS